MPMKPQSFRAATRRTTSGHQLARMAAEVLGRDGHQCQRCGLPCPHPKHHEADHVIALANGGDDSVANMTTLCLSCHREKTTNEARGRGR